MMLTNGHRPFQLRELFIPAENDCNASIATKSCRKTKTCALQELPHTNIFLL
jgi:hypothetical protein